MIRRGEEEKMLLQGLQQGRHQQQGVADRERENAMNISGREREREWLSRQGASGWGAGAGAGAGKRSVLRDDLV